MLPLSKLLSSAVTVCVILSLLFHFTVVPAETVIVPGEKLMFTMLTPLAEEAGVLLELLLLEHEKNAVKNSRLKLAQTATLLIFFIVFILKCKERIRIATIVTSKRSGPRLLGENYYSNLVAQYSDLVRNEKISKMLKARSERKVNLYVWIRHRFPRAFFMPIVTRLAGHYGCRKNINVVSGDPHPKSLIRSRINPDNHRDGMTFETVVVPAGRSSSLLVEDLCIALGVFSGVDRDIL